MHLQNNLRILIIGTIPPPIHGSNLYMKNFINELSRTTINYYHLDISDHRDINNLGKIDFTNIYLGIKSLIDTYLAIKMYKPTVIYCNHASTLIPFIRDGLIILTAKKLSRVGEKIKIFSHLHSGLHFRHNMYNKGSIITKKLIEYVLKNVDVALVLGNKLKSNYTNILQDVRVAPVGTDFMMVGNCRQKNERINICYLGNLYKSKGVELLFNSAINVVNNNKVVFNFAGSWVEKENEMNKYINKKIGSEFYKNIRFLGKINDQEKHEFYSKCDIFVFPTYYKLEAMPQVLIEAMAAGCAIISTKDIGVIDEMIEHGYSGLLIKPLDQDELTKCIIKLINDKYLRKKLGKNARYIYEKKYTLRKSVANIVSIMDEVVATN